MTKTFGNGIDGVHGSWWDVSMVAEQEEAWPGAVSRQRVLTRWMIPSRQD